MSEDKRRDKVSEQPKKKSERRDQKQMQPKRKCNQKAEAAQKKV